MPRPAPGVQAVRAQADVPVDVEVGVLAVPEADVLAGHVRAGHAAVLGAPVRERHRDLLTAQHVRDAHAGVAALQRRDAEPLEHQHRGRNE